MNYTLKVAECRLETEDTVTICFKQPGLKKIKYLSGQYLTLIFRINGRRYIRPYSFSSCPEVDNYLEITVKRVPRGIVSNHILDTIKPGDSIEVMSPMGDFIFKDKNEYRSVFFWGVGSGITPLISIAKHILHTKSQVKVYLIYGNRSKETTIFYNLIEDLKVKYPDTFFAKQFHTNLVVKPNNPWLVEGRINQKNAKELLEDIGDLNRSIHYICGPAGLKESVKSALQLLEVKDEDIFSEDFEIVRDPNDFAEIGTQMIGLRFKQKEYSLEVIKGKSILEAALDAEIELPYSCQTGNCSTCKGRLIAGEIKMIGLNKVRTDLAADEYLLCCSHPLTGNVDIEI
ncbi:ring-1,2-phenylacetyl-CoA epoxidase subunit PaaE [Pedobacter westerhofensis]|uniref:Ring-1,2-phenylacetyl-CoA epoxidase subunit PaaE n=1 Tax=Pedobacter westerhofensis TaxID=425512 RepID=A0A521C8K7_9SPHI|nr:ferredoxin--NADP reductase [Pedobacter westerhofensis]SMO55827.1 ring-1,2-phenylacetyl-CoA epoxidase subunit PaaE [Pedobacter westerhofensis]